MHVGRAAMTLSLSCEAGQFSEPLGRSISSSINRGDASHGIGRII